MKKTTLTLLSVITLLVAIGAVYTLKKRESAVADAHDSSKLFPELMASINDVAKMSIESAEGTITLQRQEDEWVVAEKGGYPAEAEPIRKSLIGMAGMKTVEAKTDDPERWSKLGVQAPDAVNSPSKKVTLSDAEGNELASVIVGNQRSQSMRGTSELFVRRPEENQSWVVQCELDLKDQQKDWLKREILKIERDRVRTFEITQPDGSTLHVHKASQADANYEVLGLTEDQELRYPTVANSMAGGLEYLNLDDVQPAGDVDFSSDTLSTCRCWTFDGLRITVTTKEIEGLTYARFEAAYDPEGGVPLGPAPTQEGEEEAESEISVKKTPEEVTAEAAELNAKLGSWTYVIPQYNRATFTKSLDDMVKQPEKAKAGTEDNPMLIPSSLPPEIQDQIREHQESLGNKTVTKDIGEAEDESDDGSQEEEPESQPIEDGSL